MSSIETVPIVLLQGLGLLLAVVGAMFAMANASALNWWAIIKAFGIAAFVTAFASPIVSAIFVLVLWGSFGDTLDLNQERRVQILVAGVVFSITAISSLRSVSDGYWRHCLVLIAFIVGPTLMMLDYRGIVAGLAVLVAAATVGMTGRRWDRDDEGPEDF